MWTKATPPISIWNLSLVSLIFIPKMENKLDHVKIIGGAVKMLVSLQILELSQTYWREYQYYIQL